MPWLVHRSWHHFIYTFSKGLEVISSRGCALEYWQRLLSWQSFQIFYIVSYCFVQYCALEVWRKQRWYFNSYGNSLLPMCSELCEVWELEGPGTWECSPVRSRRTLRAPAIRGSAEPFQQPHFHSTCMRALSVGSKTRAVLMQDVLITFLFAALPYSPGEK